ncbi:nitroreductase / dihydropteridine reductase [Flexibacter flexilis DSM 6793]|uniref:Nitroreductase / dihydropteridine reductase n=1 Tax=Flexibacter flexilis DSM 6793 TaxID=927664 RepID=A0A1I1L6S4_9BACT|nr:NAD(P)H-dependent oxidoreductase [Flexibacter flexilis]SFC68711.1 nitroreductase / dihydropteridine reductase [Flexibacter flexilis DSM 6793]
MSYLETVRTRYTTKKYDANIKINNQQINELMKVLHLAPSSINSQPWRFIFVADQQIKEQLSKVSFHNTDKLLHCSHVVVLAVEKIDAFEKRLPASLPSGAVEYYHKMIKPKGEEHVKTWMSEQVYIALGFLLSAVASLGIDSTAMGGIMPDQYDAILKLEGCQTLVAVALGGRAADDANQLSVIPKRRRPFEDVVYSI